MREVNLLDSCGEIPHMQHRRSIWPHDEGWLLDRVVADGNDQIGAIDRIVDIVAFWQSGRAHVKTGPAGDGTLTHLRVEERNLHALNEIRQSVGEAGAARRRTKHDEWPLGFQDERGRTIERRSLGDGHLDRVRLDKWWFPRRLCRNVLRQLEMHRTRPL